MKRLIGALVLLCLAAPAAAQDCPVKHPALTALDHASMAAAVEASFRGLYGRHPTGQAGAGADDTNYWVAVSDHYGGFSDGICRAGWSAYWELKLGGTDSANPALGDQPARFRPSTAPPAAVVPVVEPPAAPVPPLPSTDLTPVLLRLEILEHKVDDLRASLEQFHEEVRATWKAVAKKVSEYAALIVPALLAGRATR